MPKNSTTQIFLITVCLLFFTTATFAQRTITGKVTGGTNNQGVAGATVAVKGTTIATQTDANGNFTLKNAPANGSSLVITNVGYESAEVAANARGPINVSLKAANAALTEVIVTGYSSQAKKDITGSVAVVNVKELTANPGSNIQNLLQGRAAGVTVGTSGIPVLAAMCEFMVIALLETMNLFMLWMGHV